MTKDLDICYRRTPANIARLAGVLAPFRPKLRGMPADLLSPFDERTLLLGTNFTLDIGEEEMDLLGEMSAIGGFEQIVGHAVELPVAGVQVKVLSLAQLIATKEAAGRPKDHAVLPVLKATLELQKKQAPPPHEPPAGT